MTLISCTSMPACSTMLAVSHAASGKRILRRHHTWVGYRAPPLGRWMWHPCLRTSMIRSRRWSKSWQQSEQGLCLEL